MREDIDRMVSREEMTYGEEWDSGRGGIDIEQLKKQFPNVKIFNFSNGEMKELGGVKDMGKCECGNEISTIGWEVGDATREYCEECYIEDQFADQEKMAICAEDMCENVLNVSIKDVIRGAKDNCGLCNVEEPPIREDSFKFNTKCVCSKEGNNDYPCMCDIHEDEEEKDERYEMIGKKVLKSLGWDEVEEDEWDDADPR